MNEAVLRLAGIRRTFDQGREALEVLRGIDLRVGPGEVVALVGPSGAGKSTLLHIAGLLEAPNAGKVHICGRESTGLDDDGRTRIRRDYVGFVYQYHHLLPEFSALENVIIPQIIGGLSRSEARQRALEILRWLGLAERVNHRPGKLSGGEQQRVAIGRALANAPKLLLADEPTGNLDPGTASDVFDVLIRSIRSARLGALIATHNPDLAAKMDRIVRLSDGILVAG